MLSKFSFFEFPYWIRGILFEGKTSWEKVGFRIKRPQKFNEIFQLNWNLHSCSKFKIAVVEIMESKIYYFTLKDDSYYSGNSWMVFNVPILTALKSGQMCRSGFPHTLDKDGVKRFLDLHSITVQSWFLEKVK